MELIERKAKGEDIVVEPDDAAPQVTDLMDALRASVEESAHRGQHGTTAATTHVEGLDDLTKQQLYERAADADVKGRSTMSDDELVQACGSGPPHDRLHVDTLPGLRGRAGALPRCRRGAQRRDHRMPRRP